MDEKFDHRRPLKPPSKPNFERPPGHSRPGRVKKERDRGILSPETHIKERDEDQYGDKGSGL